MSTAESQLINWFNYLKAFKASCAEVNTDAVPMTLLAFANSKITDLLAVPPSGDQPAFGASASNATKLPVGQDAISGASTFLSLLEAVWAFPDAYVSSYVQSLCPAFSGTNPGDFLLERVTVVFPEGATDSLWIQIDAALANVIGSDCYSAAHRKKVAAIVADRTKLISDVVDQIVVFG